MNKLDSPVLNWPKARFPELKYPLKVCHACIKDELLVSYCCLQEYVRENREEEQRCLDQVRDLFEKNKVDQPIATAIIEPIQSEGG